MKKILFSLFMLLPMMASAAYEYDAEINGLYFKFEDGKAIVVEGSYGGYSGDISIPNKVMNDDISYLVTGIGENAFSNCTGLKSISFGKNVTTLGYGAFLNCTALESIKITAAISELGDRCFEGCSSLTNITVVESNPYFTCEHSCNCIIDINSGELLFGCSTTNIPIVVTKISDAAFYGMVNLTNISIPSTVKNIGSHAFKNCNSLINVTNLSKTPQPIAATTFSTYGTLHVLPGCKEAYEAAEYWKNFTIVEDAVSNEIACADPTIEYVDGCFDFKCATPDAKFHYTITHDSQYAGVLTDGQLKFGSQFEVSVYATSEGYVPSETITKVINISEKVEVPVEVEVPVYVYDGEVNSIELSEGQKMDISVKANSVTIENAPADATILVYNIAGALVEKVEVKESSVTISLTQKDTYVFKVADKTFKVMYK